MEEKDYVVTKIDGEYVYLREVDKGEDTDVYVALYLLPLGITIGSKLHSAFFEYTLID